MGRKKKLDGRSVRGTRMALQNALTDEARDAHYIEMLNSRMSYTAMGEELGVSRQRATELVHRAVVRKAMLLEHRNGKSVEHLSADWKGIYPQSKRAKDARTTQRAKREQDALNGGPAKGSADHGDRPDLSPDQAEGQEPQTQSQEVE